eukprot:scaffold3977_cov316-Prasinococcus_capsulatus_cf.AAC.1
MPSSRSRPGGAPRATPARALISRGRGRGCGGRQGASLHPGPRPAGATGGGASSERSRGFMLRMRSPAPIGGRARALSSWSLAARPRGRPRAPIHPKQEREEKPTSQPTNRPSERASADAGRPPRTPRRGPHAARREGGGGAHAQQGGVGVVVLVMVARHGASRRRMHGRDEGGPGRPGALIDGLYEGRACWRRRRRKRKISSSSACAPPARSIYGRARAAVRAARSPRVLLADGTGRAPAEKNAPPAVGTGAERGCAPSSSIATAIAIAIGACRVGPSDGMGWPGGPQWTSAPGESDR